MPHISAQQRQAAVEAASAAFGNGSHCAEAVASAVLEAVGVDASEARAHATAFGGGIGETFAGPCGALSGALVAIGHLYGRRESGGEWGLPAELGAQMHNGFVSAHHTAHCAALRERFGEERQMGECRKLVAATTERLLALLSDPGCAAHAHAHGRDEASGQGTAATCDAC